MLDWNIHTVGYHNIWQGIKTYGRVWYLGVQNLLKNQNFQKKLKIQKVQEKKVEIRGVGQSIGYN